MVRPSPLLVRLATGRSPRSAAVLVAGLAAGALLTGCGSDDATTADDPAGESSSATPAPSESAASPSDAVTSAVPSEPASSDATTFDLPACDAVWVAGQKLPGGYEGCLAADGSPVDAGGRYCEFGKPIFTYGKRFYAVANGPVNQTDGPVSKDPAYRIALRKCGG